MIRFPESANRVLESERHALRHMRFHAHGGCFRARLSVIRLAAPRSRGGRPSCRSAHGNAAGSLGARARTCPRRVWPPARIFASPPSPEPSALRPSHSATTRTISALTIAFLPAASVGHAPRLRAQERSSSLGGDALSPACTHRKDAPTGASRHVRMLSSRMLIRGGFMYGVWRRVHGGVSLGSGTLDHPHAARRRYSFWLCSASPCSNRFLRAKRMRKTTPRTAPIASSCSSPWPASSSLPRSYQRRRSPAKPSSCSPDSSVSRQPTSPCS